MSVSLPADLTDSQTNLGSWGYRQLQLPQLSSCFMVITNGAHHKLGILRACFYLRRRGIRGAAGSGR
jgi:hypothetical protein